MVVPEFAQIETVKIFSDKNQRLEFTAALAT
jgi:hypothetical protein